MAAILSRPQRANETRMHYGMLFDYIDFFGNLQFRQQINVI